MYLFDLSPFLEGVVTLVKLSYVHEKLPRVY